MQYLRIQFQKNHQHLTNLTKGLILEKVGGINFFRDGVVTYKRP